MNAFVTQVWLADTTSGSNIQITRGEKGASNYQWSPDGTWLTFTSTRAGDKSQIFALRPDGGEAMQWTKSETGVNSYAGSRDGKTIAFTATGPVPQPEKDRKEYLDEYKVVRREYSHVHLWTFDVAGTLVLLDGVVRSFCFIWMRQIHSSKLWYRETTNRYWAPPIDTCFFFKASIFS